MTTCPPGEHPTQLTYRAARWTVCSPDVPGNGLPWDNTTLLTLWATLTFMVLVIGYLLWLTWTDPTTNLRNQR